MIGCKPSCLAHISAPFRPIATAMSSQTSQNLFSNFWIFASTLIVGQAPSVLCRPEKSSIMTFSSATLPFSVKLKSPQDNSLHCEQMLRELPGKRLVCSGTWRQCPVVVKLFLDPKNALRHWTREKNGVVALANSRVRTPQMLFSGQLTDETFVLVFECLPQAQTALQLWNKLSSTNSRLSFMQQLVESIGELHDAGLMQEDLHLANFLVSDQKIYVIDGDAINSVSGGKPLDLTPSSKNLALFFAQILPVYDSLVTPTTLHYAKQRKLSGDLLLDRLTLDLPDARSRRRHKYVKKSYRTCDEFVRSKRSGMVAICRRQAQGEILTRLLDDPDAFMRDGELLKDGNTSTVVRIQTDGCDWVVKRYNIKNPWHALQRCFRSTRAWVSWGNAQRLTVSGVSTPRSIAVVEKRIGPLRSTGYYVCDFVDGANAEAFFQDDAVEAPVKEQVTENFAHLFALFYKLNICHGDCKATNFLLKDNEPWVLDLDAMQECSSPTRFKKLFQIDRQRFLRNWQGDPELQKWFDDHLPE